MVKNIKMKKTIYLLVAIIIVLIFNFPIIATIFTSLKTKADISATPPKLFFKPVLEHYKNVLYGFGYDFPQFFVNSIIVSLGASILVLLLCIPAAYSINHFFKGKSKILASIMSLKLIPPVVFAIPMFILFQTLRLLDTRTGLILVNTLFNIPFGILILVGFLRDIPHSIEEAAKIDGASNYRIIWNIILPLLSPALGSVLVLTFIWTWNEYFFALIMTMNKATTVTVGASLFVTAWEVQWGEISAAVSLSIIPILIFTILMQKYLIKAITFGNLK